MALYFMYVPGFACSYALLELGFRFTDDGVLYRANFWSGFTTPMVIIDFFIFWIINGINLALWCGCEWGARKRNETLSEYPNVLLKWSLIFMLALTTLGTAYLATYTTLEEAVNSGDLELAEKRLKFNLLGVGASDGAVISVSTTGTVQESLLPLAVKNGDLEMARLLLEHGANVHKGSPVHGWGKPIGVALSNRDLPMARLLIEAGARLSEETRNFGIEEPGDVWEIFVNHRAGLSGGSND